ncbi:hypothetical protein [Pseudomonas cremoricolorata]|uniref:hypothetical protein n=1 Tax=Pseudomonas cremoricolorata TaxID=157783 RepID=UPI001969DED3|nr:hypothetical protein [Pseudomonas cremoricolorata]
MTLLEVVVGLGVLAVGVLSATALQLRAVQATDDARRHTAAVWLAQGVMEWSRAAGALSASQQALWQARLRAELDEQAQGRIVQDAPALRVEVRWPRRQVAEQGWVRLNDDGVR